MSGLYRYSAVQALKDRCRHELALDLLRDPALPFGEIAVIVGWGYVMEELRSRPSDGIDSCDPGRGSLACGRLGFAR